MNVNLANWKTTLAGCLLGAVEIVAAYLRGELDAKAAIIGVALAVLGYLAKDATTGSTPADGKLRRLSGQ